MLSPRTSTLSSISGSSLSATLAVLRPNASHTSLRIAHQLPSFISTNRIGYPCQYSVRILFIKLSFLEKMIRLKFVLKVRCFMFRNINCKNSIVLFTNIIFLRTRLGNLRIRRFSELSNFKFQAVFSKNSAEIDGVHICNATEQPFLFKHTHHASKNMVRSSSTLW